MTRDEYLELEETLTSKVKEIYVGKTIRFFISYSAENNQMAGLAKQWLEEFGFEVFVAHDDMDMCNDFPRKIKDELNKCDIVVALLSKEFKVSGWCDQEIGYAIARDKTIAPFKLDDTNSYGFFRDAHAKFIGDDSKDNFIAQIINFIKENNFTQPYVDALIRKYRKSRSFSEAGNTVKQLEEIKTFAPEQVNELIRSYLDNNQISHENASKKFIGKVFQDNISYIDEDFQKIYPDDRHSYLVKLSKEIVD